MRKSRLLLLAMATLAGCGGESTVEPSAPVESTEAVAIVAPEAVESAAPATSEPATPTGGKDVGGILMFDLPPVTIGPYTVQPMYEEKLEDGHFNLRISGGEVAAVREWVGPEDASGVMVVKTEIERDYWHGHVEMPDPIPADLKLWIEIESPTGEKFKGSTPLK